VERRMLHVVADVVRVRLRVFHALLEVAVGPFMRPGVVNRLPLREQIDGAVDARRLRSVRGEMPHRHNERHSDAYPTQVLRGMLHGVILQAGVVCAGFGRWLRSSCSWRAAAPCRTPPTRPPSFRSGSTSPTPTWPT